MRDERRVPETRRTQMERQSERYQDVWWALRVGLGATAFLAGLDKFTHLLTDWDKYLSPRVEAALPMSGPAFMKLVGVVEMAVGLGILMPPRTKLHAYAMSAWLLGIAGNLALHDEDYLDIAVRDLNIALGAFALARLTGERQAGAARRQWLPERTADVGRGLRSAVERNGVHEPLPEAA